MSSFCLRSVREDALRQDKRSNAPNTTSKSYHEGNEEVFNAREAGGCTMSVRFIHTSDWQLGMTRYFLSEGAQELYSQSRFDVIRAMGRIAKQERCQFMLVSGDAFESNQVDRRTVARALEALREVRVPVYILPGNHDPLNAGSVYHSRTFAEKKPDHVHVLEDSTPIAVAESVELVGAPWMAIKVAINPINGVLEALQRETDITRICVAHGVVDQFAPQKDGPGVIPAELLEDALGEGKIHFVALGDRHSLTKVGSGNKIWYPGTPEATDFREKQPGYAQVVEITDGQVVTQEFQVGKWSFVEWDCRYLNSAEDVKALKESLDEFDHKERVVVRLKLVGALSLSLRSGLDECLAHAKDVFGAFLLDEEELLMRPEDADFSDLGLSGSAEATVKELRARIEVGGEQGAVASDALMLLLRLTKGAA